MSHQKILGKTIRAAAICTLLWLSNVGPAYAQHLNSHELQITSPAANTVVNPGQPVQVVVTPSAGVRLHRVAIISDQLDAASAPLHSPPFVFSLTPPGAKLGSYRLTAWAVNENERTVVSVPVSVDIEPADNPAAIAPLMSQLIFRSQGQTSPLRIAATLANGSVADATESSNLTYASANTGVATVDSNGMVTAVAPGSTSITVTYGGSSNLKITIPVSVQSGGVGIAPAGFVFPAEQVGSTSAPEALAITNHANGPVTIRSLHASGDFTESDNCVSASPLAPGASCTATVSFAPSAAGTRAGSLTVSDNFDGVSPSITLTGTAVPAPGFSLSVTPARERVSRDHPATYELTITPVGGFTGTVNLSCAGEPEDSTCSISPASAPLDGTNPSAASVTVSLERRDRDEKSPDDPDDHHHEPNEHRKFTLTLQGTAGNLSQSTDATLIVEESSHHHRD